MSTDNNRIRPRTIDIHCHLHTEAAEALVNETVPAEKRPRHRDTNAFTAEVTKTMNQKVYPQLTSVEQRLIDMDATGIDVQVLATTTNQYYYWTDPELGQATSRIINDHIAAIVSRVPNRFVGLATLPMQSPDFAVEELERAVKQLGLRGMVVGSNIAGEDISGQRFRKVFAKAEELDVVIFLHPFNFAGGPRMSDHHLVNIIGNPLESTIAIAHLIFDGVLEEFPNLKICIAHGGGFLPAYLGRADHAHAVRPDCRTVIERAPSHYLKRLYFDTLVFTHHQLEYLVAQFGAEHILLGTDYPYDMRDEDPVGFVQGSPNLSAEDKAAVSGGNAAFLLKLLPRR
jgi:aminocarboxymuconate-semialdehyde decarboxylase